MRHSVTPLRPSLALALAAALNLIPTGCIKQSSARCYEPEALETTRAPRRLSQSPTVAGELPPAVEKEELAAAKDGSGLAREARKVEMHAFQAQQVAPESQPSVLAHGGDRPVNGEKADAMFHKHHGVNPFFDTDEERFSTFAMDVDTASYTLARQYLNRGQLPPESAVRVEEFVNRMHYDDPAPVSEDFRITVEGAPSPFGARHQLLRIGLKGRALETEKRAPAHLTFCIDVSGSMDREDRLELVKRALGLLLDQLRPSDQVALVVYGSNARVVLEPSSLERQGNIRAAIAALRPEGATNVVEGLETAYRVARAQFAATAVNKIILCSDGVANTGSTTEGQAMLDRVGEAGRKGIALSTVGFGMGNYNDVLLEKLANRGDGQYAYVDTIDEAKRCFVENLTGMLNTIARDAKLQVEFHAAAVRSFRLLGYENRHVDNQDFRNDAVDAGEIGVGHHVTALYEVKLKEGAEGPLCTVRLRHKPGLGDTVVEHERGIEVAALASSLEAASDNLKLAAVTAEFAEVLRGSVWARGSSLAAVLETAEALKLQGLQANDVADLCGMARAAIQLQGGRPERPQVDPIEGAQVAPGGPVQGTAVSKRTF